MNRKLNPYPELLIDEASGIAVPDIRHSIWLEGYKAARESRPVIKNAIRAQNGMVLVFDSKGEQIPEYQGQYEEVKPLILKDAPPSAVFSHALDYETGLTVVARDEW